jgi:hypothetical protein
MSHRCVVLFCAMVVAVAFAPVSVAYAQSNSEWSVPRTAAGQPDLQGVWDFRTLTPLQRPDDRAEQALLTEEEVAEIEARSAASAVEADQPSEVRSEPLPAGQNVGGYNNFWFDRGAGVVDDRRTSLINDPVDGRVPALRDGIRHQLGSLGEDLPSPRPILYRAGGAGVDGPEDRGLAERCILGFNSGPPMLPGGYNQNMQLFQTTDHVVILNEMVHDSRIIPMDGREHLPGDMQQWMGDSRGYWDGDTLVVETTNFTEKTASFNPSVMVAMGSGENLRLIERFTRVDEETLSYEYSVYDPKTFTRPFSAEIPMKRGAAPIFEYACHEGNYGLLNILRGARDDEAKTAALN